MAACSCAEAGLTDRQFDYGLADAGWRAGRRASVAFVGSGPPHTAWLEDSGVHGTHQSDDLIDAGAEQQACCWHWALPACLPPRRARPEGAAAAPFTATA